MFMMILVHVFFHVSLPFCIVLLSGAKVYLGEKLKFDRFIVEMHIHFHQGDIV